MSPPFLNSFMGINEKLFFIEIIGLWVAIFLLLLLIIMKK